MTAVPEGSDSAPEHSDDDRVGTEIPAVARPDIVVYSSPEDTAPNVSPDYDDGELWHLPAEWDA